MGIWRPNPRILGHSFRDPLESEFPPILGSNAGLFATTDLFFRGEQAVVERISHAALQLGSAASAKQFRTDGNCER